MLKGVIEFSTSLSPVSSFMPSFAGILNIGVLTKLVNWSSLLNGSLKFKSWIPKLGPKSSREVIAKSCYLVYKKGYPIVRFKRNEPLALEWVTCFVDYQAPELNAAIVVPFLSLMSETVLVMPSTLEWKSLPLKPSIEPLYFLTVL